MNTLFSPPIHGAKFLPTGLKNVAVVISSPFGTDLIHFSVTLNPGLHRMGTNPNSLCHAKNKKNVNPMSFFTVDYLKLL